MYLAVKKNFTYAEIKGERKLRSPFSISCQVRKNMTENARKYKNEYLS